MNYNHNIDWPKIPSRLLQRKKVHDTTKQRLRQVSPQHNYYFGPQFNEQIRLLQERIPDPYERVRQLRRDLQMEETGNNYIPNVTPLPPPMPPPMPPPPSFVPSYANPVTPMNFQQTMPVVNPVEPRRVVNSGIRREHEVSKEATAYDNKISKRYKGHSFQELGFSVDEALSNSQILFGKRIPNVGPGHLSVPTGMPTELFSELWDFYFNS